MQQVRNIVGSVWVCLLLIVSVAARSSESLSTPQMGDEQGFLSSLSEDERHWLKTHPVITIGVDHGFAPFEFVDKTQRYRGAAADYTKLIAQRLGVELKPRIGLSWKETMVQAKRGDIDLLPCIGITEERKKFFAYSRPYLAFPRSIFVRRGSTITSLADLKGKRLGVQEASSHDGFIKENTDLEPVRYSTFQEAMLGLSGGHVDAVVGNLAVGIYCIRDCGLLNLTIGGNVSDITYPLAFAVKKEWGILARLIDKALLSITREEELKIRKRWFDSSVSLAPVGNEAQQHNALGLTEQEQHWLNKHKEIIIAFDGDYAPYSWRNSSGEFVGIAVDFTREIARRAGISLKIHKSGVWKELYSAAERKEVDVIATLTPRKPRFEKFNFTQSYLSLALYVVTRIDREDIYERDHINGKTVALVEGYSSSQNVMEEFPSIKPLYVDSLTDALTAVSDGRADAAVAGIGLAQHLIASKRLQNLKFAAHYAQGKSLQAFGVRKDWPELASILDKALQSLDEKNRLEIFQQWSRPEIAQVEVVRSATTQTRLTLEELVWLQANPLIDFALDDFSAPYQFVSVSGKVEGICPDILRAIETRLGIRFNLLPQSAEQIDLTTKSGRVPAFGMWTESLLTDKLQYQGVDTGIKAYVSLFGRPGSQIVDPATMEGKTIVVIPGSTGAKLEQLGVKNEIIVAPDVVSALGMLISGKADYGSGYSGDFV